MFNLIRALLGMVKECMDKEQRVAQGCSFQMGKMKQTLCVCQSHQSGLSVDQWHLSDRLSGFLLNALQTFVF